MSQKFIKTKEDFVCKVCEAQVEGNGYTDHCPFCLWSRHMDIFPGDRQNPCRGLMEPVGLIRKKGEWRIVYRCQRCGERKINKASPADNLFSLYQWFESLNQV